MTAPRKPWATGNSRGADGLWAGAPFEVVFEHQRLLDHVALEYSSDDELRSAVSSFVDEGLRRGEPVVVTGPDAGARVEEFVDPADAGAGRVRHSGHPSRSFEPSWSSYEGAQEKVTFIGGFDTPRPAPMVAALRHAVDEHLDRGAARVRVIGHRARADTLEGQWAWARYEAVINRVFAATPLSLLCPYDLRGLPPPMRRQAEQTHPTVLGARGRRRSAAYLDPAVLLRQYEPPRLPLEDAEPGLDIPIDRTAGMSRRAVRDAVEPAGLPPDRVSDLVMAFNEVATNALVHGLGAPRVRVWAANGVAVCTVSDEGTAFDDPLAGYVPPPRPEMSDRGMGLWLSRQLCDDVDIAPSAAGLCVRLVVRAG